MCLMIISYILIIIGFILFLNRKRIKRSDQNLKVAKITGITKIESRNYELVIQYSFDEGMTFKTDTLQTRKKKSINDDIIIKLFDDGSIKLYEADKKMILICIICWIIGIMLLCIP